jgi:hypothetical protein
MMNTIVEPAALSTREICPTLRSSEFCTARMNNNPHVNGIYFTANRVKVWSGRISKDAAGK